MKNIKLLILAILLINFSQTFAQVDIKPEKKQEVTAFRGLHVGIVHPLVAMNQGTTSSIADDDFYAIGFPIGITFNTSCNLLFDIEFVPFINPGNDLTPHSTHLLFHPGILKPLGKGFTFGVRAAFELGQGQFGFTPLLNKAFKLKNGSAFFTELVLPGRFGPDENSGYTQVIALHLGIGF